MPHISPEHQYTNPYSETAPIPFRQWLAHDPHFFGLNRPDIRRVQRVIRLLDIQHIFTDTERDYITHDYRLALTVRYAADTYNPEEIFDLFGINRKTIAMYTIMTSEPRGASFYGALQNALHEIKRRKEERQQKKVLVHIEGRRSKFSNEEKFQEVEPSETIAG